MEFVHTSFKKVKPLAHHQAEKLLGISLQERVPKFWSSDLCGNPQHTNSIDETSTILCSTRCLCFWWAAGGTKGFLGAPKKRLDNFLKASLKALGSTLYFGSRRLQRDQSGWQLSKVVLDTMDKRKKELCWKM